MVSFGKYQLRKLTKEAEGSTSIPASTWHKTGVFVCRMYPDRVHTVLGSRSHGLRREQTR